MSKLQTALISLLVIGVLWVGQEVFIPLTLACLLAMLLAGPVRRLERLRFPRVLSVTTVVVIAFGILIAIGWIVGNQIYSLALDLEKYQGEIIRKVTWLRGTEPSVVEKVEATVEKVQEAANRPTTTAATEPTTAPTTQPLATVPVVGSAATEAMRIAGVPPAATQPAEASDVDRGTRTNPLYAFVMPAPSPLKTFSGYAGLAITPLATAGLVLVFVFFILLGREDLRDRMIRLVSNGRYTLTTTAVDDGVDRIVRYIRAQAIVNGTYGVTVAIGLWLIGLFFGGGGENFPSFLLWGLLACVLRFVPYIGPWIAATFPMAISIAAYPGFTVFIAVLVMFIVIELASNNIMEPILYGATTGLSVMAILVAAIFWTWLWGPIGLLLATPLTVVLMVIGRYVPGLKFLEVLLGDKPAMSPCERVYQRLLAEDDEEAMEIAQEYADENGLLATFDKVLLPALALSERDAGQGLLDEERQDAVRQGMRKIITQLGLDDGEAKADEAKAAVDKAEKAGEFVTPITPQPDDTRVRVAVLPAHDEADELAGLMLCRLLQNATMLTLHLSHHVLAGEMVEQVRTFKPHVVFISSTPPSGVSHVRYLLRRVRGGLADEKLAIGVWTAKSDVEILKKRLELNNAPLATNFAQAVEQVKQITETERYGLRTKGSSSTPSETNASPEPAVQQP